MVISSKKQIVKGIRSQFGFYRHIAQLCLRWLVVFHVSYSSVGYFKVILNISAFSLEVSGFELLTLSPYVTTET